MQSSGPVSLAPADTKSPAIEVTVVSAFPGVHTAYAWHNFVITVWFGPATMQSLIEFEKGCRSFYGKHPKGLSSVHIMVPGGKAMPSAEVRARVGKIMRDNAERTVAAATLIPGNGFWASALRSMVTAILMLAPRSLAFRIFGDLESLAEWLAPLHAHGTGVSVEARELFRAMRFVQRSAVRAAA